MTALLWGLAVLSALAWISVEVMRWDLRRKGAADPGPMGAGPRAAVLSGLVAAVAGALAARRGVGGAGALSALGVIVATLAAAAGRRP